MSERVVPILPCRELDEIVDFYKALGFSVTYRQQRPNPYLCVKRGGFDLHFSGITGFDPETSIGSALLVTDDTGSLFDSFAAGLKQAFGRLPITGIPRITRPRRKQGMAAGFTVVDPAGNWIRVVSAAEPADSTSSRLERVVLNAARQGDSHGDVDAAIAVLDAGLARHDDETGPVRARALLYLVELLIRNGDRARARATACQIDANLLTADERDQLAELLTQR